MLSLKQNVPLSGYSTMRLGGPAAYLTEVSSLPDVQAASDWAEEQKLPLMMIGSGSNIIWPDEGYGGLVVVNKIMGYQLQNIDAENVYLTVGAGEPWDSVVARTVLEGLSGIEQLSLIPGTVGATPVQNVGAYGREIAEVLALVQAYDRQIKQMVTIAAADCAFAYRTSRFKTTDKGRFLITSVTLHLAHTQPLPPFYPSVQAYFEQHAVTNYTPAALREAVVDIRRNKLPDPAVVANCGSFFFNPVLSSEQFSELQQTHPGIPSWSQAGGGVKVSAAWLIEQAGFKAYRDPETGMAVWPKQSLTFINEHARSVKDVVAFKDKVANRVKEMFGITLTPEPELVQVINGAG